MKKIGLLFIILFCENIFSQEKQKNDYKKLIDSAIIIKENIVYKNYIDDLNKKKYTENWKIHKANLEKYVNNIYVTNENFEFLDLYNIKTKIPLKSINIKDLKNKKLFRKTKNLWKVIPILQGKLLTIKIIDFSVQYKNKKYHLDNGGGSTIIFEYSCSEEKWILISEEHKGN